MSDQAADGPLGIPTGFGPSGRVGAQAPVARVRLTFTKEGPLRYIGHLDLVRMWERAFRRAKLPLAYTAGFTPHPRLTFAAPLALGATSEAELLDVYLRVPLASSALAEQIASQLPPGCRVLAAHELTPDGPPLSAQIRWASYLVQASAAAEEESTNATPLGSRWGRTGGGAGPEIGGDPAADVVPWRPAAERLVPPAEDPPLPTAPEIQDRIGQFLVASSWLITRARDGKQVDARAGALGLLPGAGERARIGLEMVLKLDSSGAGRPDDVAAALGLRARTIHRVRIGLEGEPPPL